MKEEITSLNLKETENIQSSSPYNNMIETFKNIIDMGATQPKYFIQREALNCNEDNFKIEKFNLEKILKLNAFCEEVETMGVSFQNLRNQNKQNLNNNWKNQDKELNFDGNNGINTNVIRMASDRRISVYENLFENIKTTFEDIMKITEMKINQNKSKGVNEEELPNVITGSRIKDNRIQTAENFIKKTENLKEVAESSFGSSESMSDEEDSVNEGVVNKNTIPISKIRNVNLNTGEQEDKIPVPLHRRDTLKDVLVYDRKVRMKIKTFLERHRTLKSQDSRNSFKSNKETRRKETHPKEANETSSAHLRFESLAR
jgi:hypothetical protein